MGVLVTHRGGASREDGLDETHCAYRRIPRPLEGALLAEVLRCRGGISSHSSPELVRIAVLQAPQDVSIDVAALPGLNTALDGKPEEPSCFGKLGQFGKLGEWASGRSRKRVRSAPRKGRRRYPTPRKTPLSTA